MKQKRGIFISYRRSTGSTLARMIYDRLRFEMKYQCFLDVKELDAGNFRKQIREKMDNCDIEELKTLLNDHFMVPQPDEE